MDHTSHMRAALGLARRNLGDTWPNPSVGCVIVCDGVVAGVGAGVVVGRAVTAPQGRPHAEPQALAMAGARARGATAYVTLEPCCFHGRTPPCTEALIAAGIARVVIGARDPDPRVDGRGIARLREAGIEVIEGVLPAEAAEAAAGLYTRIQAGRPLVTLKLASTLDGKIATSHGESRWITGPAARRATHALRGRHDAVMVGVGTAIADNPDLTCRIPGFKHVPGVRVVVDSRLRLPLTSQLVATARTSPTWVLTREDADTERAAALQAAGVELLRAPAAETGIDLPAALHALAERGLTRVLAEGGAALAAALLRADLVDRIAWFHAPTIMGADGLPATEAFGIEMLTAMPRFKRTSVQPVGDDVMTEFTRTPGQEPT